jgi:hypothetical protein
MAKNIPCRRHCFNSKIMEAWHKEEDKGVTLSEYNNEAISLRRFVVSYFQVVLNQIEVKK